LIQGVFCSLVLFSSSFLLAQGGAPRSGTTLGEKDPADGKKILDVEISGARSLPAEVLLHVLGTKKGGRLNPRIVREDLTLLWRRFKVRGQYKIKEVPGGVRVLVVIHEFPTYKKVAFRGLVRFSEERVRNLLDLREGESQTLMSANNLARTLETQYKKEGYHFVKIRVQAEAEQNQILFIIDEGPRVRVRKTDIRGNKNFPDWVAVGWVWNILGSSGFQSKPGFLSDAIFSRKVLQEDLDRVRNFYHDRGYRDALVSLERLDFIDNFSGVSIVVRVYEGPLYRVSAVDLQQIPPVGEKKPLFPKKMLLAKLKLKTGDILTADLLERDKDAIARFYGRRGFPNIQRFPTLDRGSAFEVLEPQEVVDPQKHEVRITYRVREGRKKTLRNVRIRGNKYTKDFVLRREISVFPGETLDMVELEKSENRLNSLRYFGDQDAGKQGVLINLVPVQGEEDKLDLDVKVEEGTTGNILWGFGVSSQNGFFGNVTYRKRNFDWKKPPKGINPISWFSQILNNEAFHGAGQTFNLDLTPGVQQSQFSASFLEPDLFSQHFDPTGLNLQGYRLLRAWDSHFTDTFGGQVGLERRLGRDAGVSLRLREDRVRTYRIDGNAPAIVWDAEGKETIRSLRVGFNLRSLDRRIRPTSGFRMGAYGEIAPESLGGEAHFWKAGINGRIYIPIARDSKERAHVLEIRNQFDVGRGLGEDKNLFLTERFWMGGQSTLRGFSPRKAGPMQFGNPTFGEMRYLGSIEYGFPLFSTRMEGQFRETEIIRGLVFLDAGMLGNDFNDPIFQQLRLSTGFGFKLIVPGIGGLPIRFDFGFPILRESTDNLRFFHFSIRF
jgi:outer membrane protein insertion porin family